MPLDSLKFLYIRKNNADPTWHNQYRVHTFHELIIVLSGVMHVSGGNQKIDLHPGDAALYPAGVEHWEKSDAIDPVEHCYFVFEDPSLSGDRILVNRNQGTLLRAMASAFYDYSITQEPGPLGDEYLKLMLKIFFAPATPASRNNGMVQKVHSFILQNMARTLTLDELARVAGLSKYHFSRQYRFECGKTPVRALWEMRCSEAISLLKYTGLSIKEIAQRTGFTDITHFFHRIKAFSGKSPSEFRA